VGNELVLEDLYTGMDANQKGVLPFCNGWLLTGAAVGKQLPFCFLPSCTALE